MPLSLDFLEIVCGNEKVPCDSHSMAMAELPEPVTPTWRAGRRSGHAVSKLCSLTWRLPAPTLVLVPLPGVYVYFLFPSLEMFDYTDSSPSYDHPLNNGDSSLRLEPWILLYRFACVRFFTNCCFCPRNGCQLSREFPFPPSNPRDPFVVCFFFFFLNKQQNSLIRFAVHNVQS